MPWVITNNSFFIKSDKRGCATPVKDGKKAKVFTNLFYAEEFLRSLPKKMKNLGYLQARPGGKVQFTQSHIDKYFQRIEQEPREKYARKPKKVVAEL